MSIRLLVPIALACLLGCSDGGHSPTAGGVGLPPTTPGLVAGKVTDAEGRPLAGIQVALSPVHGKEGALRAVTDPQGGFRIELPVKGGSGYQLAFQGEGDPVRHGAGITPAPGAPAHVPARQELVFALDPSLQGRVRAAVTPSLPSGPEEGWVLADTLEIHQRIPFHGPAEALKVVALTPPYRGTLALGTYDFLVTRTRSRGAQTEVVGHARREVTVGVGPDTEVTLQLPPRI